MPLERAPDRTVQVPSDWDVPGWTRGRPAPGDPLAVVILGHVDSKRGPAVFFRLRQPRRGDAITIGSPPPTSATTTMIR